MADSNVEKECPVTPIDKLLNDTANAVKDSLLGLVSTNPFVGKLHYGNVIVRRDYEELNQVMIISGGPSGYEPTFSGFVGKGLLTASVQGDLFTVPSSKTILRTIKELHNSKTNDILVIIPSSLSECLNFGLAYQRALNESIKLKMMCISDDVVVSKARDKSGGLTGVILVQKIAGAMAEMGNTLPQIVTCCEELARNLASVTLGIKPASSTTTYESCVCKTDQTSTMEIGINLQGISTNVNQTPLKSAQETARLLINELTNEKSSKRVIFETTVPVVLLVNNLGSCSEMEQSVLVKELMQQLQSLEVQVARIYIGRFMTSLQLGGFTVTVLKLSSLGWLQYLDYGTNAPAWRGTVNEMVPLEMNKGLLVDIEGKVIPKPRLALHRGPTLSHPQANTLLVVVQFACDALLSCERQLNLIDAESAGDGDTGSRLRVAAEEILQLLRDQQLSVACPFNCLMALGKVLEGVGGLCGVLYSVMLEAAAGWFGGLPTDDYGGEMVAMVEKEKEKEKEKEVRYEVTARDWLEGLRLAVDALMKFASVNIGDNTLLDPLYECVTATTVALEASPEGAVIAAFGEGVAAAELSAQRTRIPPRRHPDAGAHAVGIWLRACYEAVKLRCED